jgi:hypothetical protein
MHTGEMVNSGKVDRQTKEPKKKPDCVLAYNSNTGVIDRSDMLSSIQYVRKSQVVQQIFSSLVIRYGTEFTNSFQCENRQEHSLADFQLNLIREIFRKFRTPRATSKRGHPSAGDQPFRLKERHFPTIVPPTAKKDNPNRRCHVCENTTFGGKRGKNPDICVQSVTWLSVYPCFEKYHTLTKY